MNRLDHAQVRRIVVFQPAAELADGIGIGPPSIWVANGDVRTGGSDDRRHAISAWKSKASKT